MSGLTCTFKTAIILIISIYLTGCATDTSSSSTKNANETIQIYEVHRDSRIHIFYNREMYEEFMTLSETLVFGLTKNDKQMKTPIAASELYDGKLQKDKIYAEMRKHDRIYVFSRFKDMEPVRSFGHPNYMYTQIGAGPKGETVVFVLNKSNKKKRPDALVAEYKRHNS